MDVQIRTAPRFELFFALAAVLDPTLESASDEAAQRWLTQARKKLDQGFRRRLGALAAPEPWRRLSALPGAAQLNGETGAVIDALAALSPAAFMGLGEDPQVLQISAVDVLRRFDRLAFAAFWRGSEPRLAAIAQSARVDPGERSEATLYFASLFAPVGYAVPLAAPSGQKIVVRFVMSADGSRRLPQPSHRNDLPLLGADPELIFRALGDATRYAIARLIAQETLTGAELARRLGVSGPTLTHHLRALRRARLVTEEKDGNRIRLRLDRRAIDALSASAAADLFGERPVTLRRSRRA